MPGRPIEPGLERFTHPFGQSGMTGFLLGLNAIPDAFLLNDCSACAPIRGELIHGTHDWTSTILSTSGRHRVAHTGLSPDRSVLDRRDLILQQLRRLGTRTDAAVILIAPAPTASMVAVDYRPLIEAAHAEVPIPILPLRLPTCTADLLSGYEAFLDVLAGQMVLPTPAATDPGKVALVGYLQDRGEADHGASIRELERLVRGLGLEIAVTWLSGAPYRDLARVAEAGTIVSLPYGRLAARTLAARTGATLVETALPVGLDGTSLWLRQVGHATARQERAERLIDAELGHWVPRLAKAADRFVLGGEFLVGLDTPLATAVADMLHEFGGRVRLVAGCGGPEPEADCPAEVVLWNPTIDQVERQADRAAESADEPAVVIGNAEMLAAAGRQASRAVPLGFPSPGTHHLFDAPFLGYAGTASLLDRIVDARVRAEWLGPA